jgi:Ca2+/H+ antiporter, TMEM165/GDT1 family
MDWKLFIASFATIFVAELGDKTQIAAFSLSAAGHKPWIVFAGASFALVCVTAIGVGIGSVAGKYIPEMAVKRSAAVIFVLLGIWTWFKA